MASRRTAPSDLGSGRLASTQVGQIKLVTRTRKDSPSSSTSVFAIRRCDNLAVSPCREWNSFRDLRDRFRRLAIPMQSILTHERGIAPGEIQNLRLHGAGNQGAQRQQDDGHTLAER